MTRPIGAPPPFGFGLWPNGWPGSVNDGAAPPGYMAPPALPWAQDTLGSGGAFDPMFLEWMRGQLGPTAPVLDPAVLFGLLAEQLAALWGAGGSSSPRCLGTMGTGASANATPSGGATSSATTTPAAPPVGIAGRRVQVFGDSLMVGAQGATREALLGAGAAQVSIDAIGGRALSKSGQGKHLSPEEIRRQVLASGAEVVVLELGSNHADYGRLIPATMEALSTLRPPPQVVWVNTQTRRPGRSSYGDAYYRENGQINAIIAQAAARYPNLRVADWANVAGGPGINGADGLHLTAKGNQAMAQVILQSLLGAASA